MGKENTFKLFAILCLHAFVYLLALLLCKITFEFFSREISNRDIIFVSLFSASYFLFLMDKLYLTRYQSYMARTFHLIFSSLPAFLFAFLLLELLYANFIRSWSLTIDLDINLFIMIKFLLLMLVYASFFFMQYRWVSHLAKLGFFRKNILIVGDYDKRVPMEQLFQDLMNTKNYVGHIKEENDYWVIESSYNESYNPMKVSLLQYFHEHHVNELVICQDGIKNKAVLNELISFCHDYNIGFYLIPEIKCLPHKKPWNHKLQYVPLVERFVPKRNSLLMISVKRAFDIVLAFLGLIIFFPLLLVIGVIVFLQDRGSIFYISDRIGIHGYPIKFIKFRSMVANAEQLKKKLMKYNERPDGPLFKMKQDPRITPFGRIMRKYSLDELPQLWNILKGDMSIIGPRPHLPEEVEEYEALDHLRLECMPGLSCLPQIKGRDEVGFREWVDLDLEYRKNWSLLYDVKIFFKTVGVVVAPDKSKLSKTRI